MSRERGEPREDPGSAPDQSRRPVEAPTSRSGGSAGRDVRPPDAPMQKRVLEILKRYPGLHLREIARQLDTSEALAGYHLDKLEERALVASQAGEGYKRFFPAKGKAHPTPGEERLLAVLRKPIPFIVALHLLDVRRAPNAELADVAEVSRPAVTYHLKTMEERGILRKDPHGLYELADPEAVAELLRKWKPTPDLVDRFAGAWSSFYRSKRR